jgi:hypothetical protein
MAQIFTISRVLVGVAGLVVYGASRLRAALNSRAKVKEILEQVTWEKGARPRFLQFYFAVTSDQITTSVLQYGELFSLPVDKLHLLKLDIIQQMDLGLKGDPGGLLMLPSFVDILPTG